jgi:hypothetical protein
LIGAAEEILREQPSCLGMPKEIDVERFDCSET